MNDRPPLDETLPPSSDSQPPNENPAGPSISIEPPVEPRQLDGETVAPASGESMGRYALVGEIARGGMGAILKVRDPNLGRDIAVKVLLEQHAGKAEMVQRFIEEARIAGQLQHPSVVPVHELGQFADKRPYFTMKLVKGQTLAALLAARRDPSEECAKFVGVFGQVCQALAYAHARGVIHRDLKPANVMVGAFGEVQVMDWGLAKVLPRDGAAGDERNREGSRAEAVSVIQTRRSEDGADGSSRTQSGSVLGTPAYMAPEQARGEVDLVDARADVFGLGAILCQILTGRPPFTGKIAESARKAQMAQLDDAFSRLDGCGADAELTGLARRCLAAEPWDRPLDAGVVAAELTAYQNSVAERLRQAELAHAAEVARTEEAQATAAQERKAREAAQARMAAERKARRLTLGLAASVLALLTVGTLGGLWMQRQQAARNAEAARLDAELRHGVASALDKATDLQKTARWREAGSVLDQVSERLGESSPEDLRRRVERAKADLGLAIRLDGIRQKRATISGGYFDGSSTDRAYAAAFQDAGIGREEDDAEVVASRIRDSAIKEHLVAALDDWASVAANRTRRSWILSAARRADPDAWRDRFRDPALWEDRAALERLTAEVLRNQGEKLAELSPQLLTALGNALLRVKADAVPLLKAARKRFPSDFWLNLRLGYALKPESANKLEERLGYFRAAVALRPESEVAHNNLGAALFVAKHHEEAIEEFRLAIQLDPTYGNPHSNLGATLRNKKQLDEAIKEIRVAIKLEPKKAMSHNNLGNALRDNKQWNEAIEEHRIAIKLEPLNAYYHHNLGVVLRDNKQRDDAIEEFHLAIQLEPKVASFHENLGLALRDNKQRDEAIEEFRIATKLAPRDTMTRYNLGLALHANKQRDEAIKEFRIALLLMPSSALLHQALANALHEAKQLNEAIQHYRMAIRLDSWRVSHRVFLGLALFEKAQQDEAMRKSRAALAAQLAQPHYRLGLLLAEKKQWSEAIAEYRIFLQVVPSFPQGHLALGNALRDNKQLSAAIAEYRLAIQLAPDYAEAHCNLGQVLRDEGKFNEAASELRRGHELGSKRSNWRYASANWVKEAERLAALDVLLPKVLTGESAVRDAARLMELARFATHHKKRFAATAGLFKDNFRLHPAWIDARVPPQPNGLVFTNRRYAVCTAAMAAAGQGDGAGLNEAQRSAWRLQALEWLGAELEDWKKHFDAAKPDASAEIVKLLDEAASDAWMSSLRLAADFEGRSAAERDAFRRRWASAARLYAQAFAQDAKLASDPRNWHRYNAACAAALAGCGKGDAADKLDDKARARLRQQSVEWLRADLAHWTKQATSANAADRQRVADTMRHWQRDSDLTGLREAEALERLPVEERQACRKLWADVAALVK